MANFIEEFYYGNLDPQARSTKENKTVQKMERAALMNNVLHRANEIIYNELIYT